MGLQKVPAGMIIDGTGSGLDADLLDGQNASVYVTSGALNVAISGSGGTNIISSDTFLNMSQNDVKIVTHVADPNGTRATLISKYIPGSQGITNTSLDFDRYQESDFIQEDINKTDFDGNNITLQDTLNTNISVATFIGGSALNNRNGKGIDVDGEWLASGDVGGGSAQNRTLYWYKKSGSAWTLTDSDTQASAYNYTHVAIDSDTTLAGEIGYHRFRVFSRSGDTWSQSAIIAGGWGYGYNMDIEGTIIMAPAHQATYDGLTSAGYVDFLEGAGASWSISQTVSASNNLHNNYYGTYVKLSGTRSFISGQGAIDNTTVDNSGFVDYLTYNGSTWNKVQENIVSPNQIANGLFGQSIAIHENTLVIGAPGENTNVGRVYVYRFNGSIWEYSATLEPSDSPTGAKFGWSVAIENGIITVGAPFDSSINPNAGSLYVYELQDNDSWLEIFKQNFGDWFTPSSNVQFGYKVLLAGGSLIASFPERDTYGGFMTYNLREWPTGKYYVTTSDYNHIPLSNINEINSCLITTDTPVNTDISTLVSFDGRVTWSKWGGASWETFNEPLSAKTTVWNTPTEISTGLTNYTIPSGSTDLDFALLLESTVVQNTPSVDQITLNYDETGYYGLINIGTEYSVEYISETQTKITKLSAGTDESVKITIIA